MSVAHSLEHHVEHRVEHHGVGSEAAVETLDIRWRLATLRSSLGDRSVLVAGDLARSLPLKRLLRLAGARVLAATDLDTALHLVRRFPIDVVLVDPSAEKDEIAWFEDAVRGSRRLDSRACFVRLPTRAA